MAKVINLNRFRKRKAKEEKEKRADTNRRLHGRTKAERMRDEQAKQRLEKKLDGAFLIRERVDVESLEAELEPAARLEALERATEQVLSLSEFSERLRREREEEASDDSPSDPE